MPRYRWILSFAAVLALVGFGLAPALAQSEAERGGGVLRVAIESSPPTLDIQVTGTASTRFIMWHVYEFLVTVDEEYNPIPGLAESWEVSDDELSYTFYLREGVRFHNGEELQAEDVKASLERYAEVGRRNNEFEVVENIEAVDTHTVRVDLKEPNVFIRTLAKPSAPVAIMPKEIAELEDVQAIDFIGTGPYRFAEWLPDRHIKLERFEEYAARDDQEAQGSGGLGGEKVAYMDEIYFIPMPEPNSRAAAIETGEVDVALGLPALTGQRYRDYPGLQVVEEIPTMKLVLNFNHQEPPTDDLKVRQAIQAALNMEEMLNIAGDGIYRLDHNILFQDMAYTHEVGSDLYNQADLERARELLAESSYDGQELIILTNNEFQPMFKESQVLAATLEQIGIDVEVEVYDASGMWAKAAAGEDWNMFTDGWISLFGPDHWASMLHSTASRWTHYQDEEMDELIAAIDRTDDPDELMQLHEQIQRKVWEEAIFYPTGDIGTYAVMADEIEGYQTWLSGARFWNVWRE